VDDKEQVNALSTKDLKNLFKLRTGTPSDTHDKLRCERCKIIHDTAELEAQKALPRKLEACRTLLEDLAGQPNAHYFAQPIDATLYGRSKEEFEQVVKQPMDFDTIRKRLDQPTGSASAYMAISDFSKDVNRVFTNVAKVWNEGDPIFDASKLLQADWMTKWTDLVPALMAMKADDDDKQGDEKDGDSAKPNDAVEALLQSCATVGNERGEDYQEQIGMPDEENMRHWSHHYSTDTVDDPIFRAAMRGTDAVSFVFGLEVTWSNLRARAEAEEEAEAMKAFSCENLDTIQEDGEPITDELPNCQGNEPTKQPVDCSSEDDESEQDDDGEDLKSFIEEDAASVGSDGSFRDRDASKANDVDTEKVGGDEEREVLLSNINVAMETIKHDCGLADSPMLGRCASILGSSNAATPLAEATINDGSSPDSLVVEGEIVNASPLAEATIDNGSSPDSMAIEGEIVNASSETSVSEAFLTAKTQIEQVPTTVGWTCTACTLVNKKSTRKCQACGTKKPAIASARKKRSITDLNS
jgi:Bromodomain